MTLFFPISHLIGKSIAAEISFMHTYKMRTIAYMSRALCRLRVHEFAFAHVKTSCSKMSRTLNTQATHTHARSPRTYLHIRRGDISILIYYTDIYRWNVRARVSAPAHITSLAKDKLYPLNIRKATNHTGTYTSIIKPLYSFGRRIYARLY